MADVFNLYAFSSDKLTNIWAGVGAELWAVSTKPNPSVRGKASKLPVPSFGILYAADEHALTVPFVILTQPHQERIETAVWPQPWALPFHIKPLGTPRQLLFADEAKKIIPSFSRLGTENFGKVFRVGGAYAFNRCDVTKEDWDVLTERLAS